MTTLGFIGAGSVAGQVARKAAPLGHRVILSNARGPETPVDLIAELGPTARAGTGSGPTLFSPLPESPSAGS
ncbi:NAD(P)-binding domain-containing protein [Streptomyces sp. NPDC090499]|uniref:NAD(P)-binding domain-containing protein n=1 Tax=Streptomyces sp. NPDC090499 TaxID=3365965 RepID=UPI0037FE893F